MIQQTLPFSAEQFLLGPEDPVAGIAQTWKNIGVLVQLTVQMSDIDLDIRVFFLKSLQTFRGGDDAHELDLLAAVFLDELQGV